jgi:Flp pilus assembly protein TadG
MIKAFCSNRSGNYAAILAIATLPLLLAVGVATDYSRHVSAQKHLQELADAASLALAGSDEKSEEKLRKLANKIILSNRSSARIENVKIVDLDTDDNWVDLRLSGDIQTTFMNLANIQTLDVGASALAERAVTGSVEVALVLDNTASMSFDDKIVTLRDAATNLVEELFGAEDADVRVGLVPYAEQINVGTANRNASWLSVPNDYSTVTPATEGEWYQPQKRTDTCKKWREAGSRQVEKDGVWVTETWGRSCSEWEMVDDGPKKWRAGRAAYTTRYKWYGCIGSRINNGKLVLDDQSPTIKYPGFVKTSKTCLTEVLPLTDEETTVTTAIEAMATARDTYIPAGVIWGVNVLSPGEPFTEGAAYDANNKKPRKVMVLMTDGLNTRRVNMSNGDYTSANSAQRLQTNTDTKTACDYAKSRKIEIFAVAFKVDDVNAKSMLQYCANSAEHYYDASDPEKLLTAFEGIGRSLRQVRLAR